MIHVLGSEVFMNRKEAYELIAQCKDNSSELYHHGILGQKWGVRRYQNEDGSYKSGAEGRYNPDYGQKLSKEQAKQFANDAENLEYFERRERLSQAIGPETLKYLGQKQREAWDLQDECEDMLKEYLNSNKLRTKYEAQAALLMFSSNEKRSMGEIARDIKACARDDWELYDDRNEFGIRAESLYAKDKGIFDKNLENIQKINAIEKETKKIAEDQVKHALGKYGNIKVEEYGSKTKVKELAVKALEASTFLSSETESATKWKPNSKISDKEISNTKKIVALMNVQNPNSWWKIENAVQAAGLENVKFSDMTDAQWQKIGEIINN